MELVNSPICWYVSFIISLVSVALVRFAWRDGLSSHKFYTHHTMRLKYSHYILFLRGAQSNTFPLRGVLGDAFLCWGFHWCFLLLSRGFPNYWRVSNIWSKLWSLFQTFGWSILVFKYYSGSILLGFHDYAILFTLVWMTLTKNNKSV